MCALLLCYTHHLVLFDCVDNAAQSALILAHILCFEQLYACQAIKSIIAVVLFPSNYSVLLIQHAARQRTSAAMSGGTS